MLAPYSMIPAKVTWLIVNKAHWTLEIDSRMGRTQHQFTLDLWLNQVSFPTNFPIMTVTVYTHLTMLATSQPGKPITKLHPHSG